MLLLLTGQAVLERSENPRCFSRFLAFPIQKYTSILLLFFFIKSLFVIEVASLKQSLGSWGSELYLDEIVEFKDVVVKSDF